MIAYFQAGACLIAACLLMAWLDRVCKRAPLIELMRWSGNEDGKRRYDARLKAAGEAPVRNVRDAAAPSLLIAHDKESA